MAKKVLALRVDPAELEKWKKAAAGEGLRLSEWIRKRFEEGPEAVKMEPEVGHGENFSEEPAGVARVRVAGRRPRGGRGSEPGNDVVGLAGRAAGRTCKHGELEGNNCWKCMGIAIVK